MHDFIQWRNQKRPKSRQ